eukprot:15530406-Heterocapsa_arctica.AAC.1
MKIELPFDFQDSAVFDSIWGKGGLCFNHSAYMLPGQPMRGVWAQGSVCVHGLRRRRGNRKRDGEVDAGTYSPWAQAIKVK